MFDNNTTFVVQGKSLSLEARLLGALVSQVRNASTLDTEISLDDLAMIAGISIHRTGDKLRLDFSLHKTKPIRIQVDKGVIDAGDILVDDDQYQTVMVDGASGCVWAVPKGD